MGSVVRPAELLAEPAGRLQLVDQERDLGVPHALPDLAQRGPELAHRDTRLGPDDVDNGRLGIPGLALRNDLLAITLTDRESPGRRVIFNRGLLEKYVTAVGPEKPLRV